MAALPLDMELERRHPPLPAPSRLFERVERGQDVRYPSEMKHVVGPSPLQIGVVTKQHAWTISEE